jgi:hypothetical protein
VKRRENCLIIDELAHRYGKLPSEILDYYEELPPLLRFYLDIHIMTESSIIRKQLIDKETEKWQKNL